MTTELAPLTDRQREVYDFIANFIETNSIAPTVQEIASATLIRSPAGALCHTRALQKKGYITRRALISRGIKLTAEVDPAPLVDDHDLPILSQKQANVFNWMLAYHAEHGYSPAIRDVAAAFNYTAPNSVVCHFKPLKRKGYIDWTPNLSRSIRFLRRTPVVEAKP